VRQSPRGLDHLDAVRPTDRRDPFVVGRHMDAVGWTRLGTLSIGPHDYRHTAEIDERLAG